MKLVKFLNEHNDDFTSKRQWVLELNRIYKSDYDNQFYRIKGVSPLLKPYSFDGAMTILHEFHHLYFESYWEEHIEMGEISDKDRKSTRLNSSHVRISYAVFCLKKKK